VFVILGSVVVFFIVRPYPFLITIVVVGIRCDVDNVLGEHQCRLIDLKVRYVLAIVGVSRFLFVGDTFTTLTILVPRFLAIAAGLGGSIAQGRPIGFSLSFWSAFLALSRPFAFVHSLTFGPTLVVAFGVVPPAFTFVILISPPSVIGGGGVVGHGRLGRGIDQFLDLEFRVTLETFVCEEFDHFVKGKGALYVAFRTGGLDRVIGSFRDAVQEPVDTLFFGRGVKGVVVGHLGN
jgi:hypothetical protein